jgi:hypothetical protein
MKFLKTIIEIIGACGRYTPSKNMVPPPPPPKTAPISLPIIRPLLGDKAPRWADETHTKCGCDLCQHWNPLIAQIEAQLDDNGKKLLEELVNDWMHNNDDLGVANAKLEGNWPGWEEMKNFKPKDTQ